MIEEYIGIIILAAVTAIVLVLMVTDTVIGIYKMHSDNYKYNFDT